MSDDDLRFALGRGVADLGERVVRHIDEIEDHRHHDDEDRETVVEMGPLDSSPEVHYVPEEVWERRKYAEGTEVYDEAYGGFVVRKLYIEGQIPIVWGVWPDIFGGFDSRTSAGDSDE